MPWGLSVWSLKIPNSRASGTPDTGETPVFPLPLPHFLSVTPGSPRLLPPHQGTMGEIKDGGKRNGGASLFPSLPPFTLGDPYLAVTLHSWPLFLASSSVTSVPSLTLVPSPPLILGVRAAGLCQAPASPTTPVSRGPPGTFRLVLSPCFQLSLRPLPRPPFHPIPSIPPLPSSRGREGQRNSTKGPGLPSTARSRQGMTALGHPCPPSG